MRDRDHSNASVATLRAELADLRPQLAKAERERDDLRTQVEVLGALCNRLKTERDAWMPKPELSPHA